MNAAPLAYTVNQACDLTGIGRTKLYEAISSGSLRTKKLGKKRIILSADLHDWLEDLPSSQPRAA